MINTCFQIFPAVSRYNLYIEIICVYKPEQLGAIQSHSNAYAEDAVRCEAPRFNLQYCRKSSARLTVHVL